MNPAEVPRDPLRIHIAGVRENEVECICGPVMELRADRLILVSEAVNDDMALTREGVRERLEDSSVKIEEVYVELGDPAMVAHALAEEISAAPSDSFRFNLSTGPREVAIGGLITAMFWPLKLYNSRIDRLRPPDDPAAKEPVTYLGVANVPAFRHELPREEVLKGLEWLVENGGHATQAALLRGLRSEEVIRPKRDGVKELSAQAAQGQLRTIVDALERLGFVERPADRRKKAFDVTPEGYMGYTMFTGKRPLHVPVG